VIVVGFRKKLCEIFFTLILILTANLGGVAQDTPKSTPETTPSPNLPSSGLFQNLNLESTPLPKPTPTPVQIATTTPITILPEIKEDKEEIKPENLIHFGDLIEVDVLGSVEFDWRGTIDSEGFLSALQPIDDPVFALCRSEEDLAKDLAKGFSKYLKNPEVVVRVLDRSERPLAFLYGAIRSPQKLQIRRPVKLSELIVLSGGITENASGEIQVYRPEGQTCYTPPKMFDVKPDSAENESDPNQNKERIVQVKNDLGNQVEKNDVSQPFMRLKISDLVAGKADANPVIRGGDVVTVLEADPVYVIGGVNIPQRIFFRQKLSVSRAIASAGGVIKGTDTTKIIVRRQSKDKPDPKIIEVNLEKIKSGEETDILLEAYDIVEVPQNGKSTTKVILNSPDSGQTQKLPLRIID
jgi:polysaccharide export outer membrane protein